MVEAYRCSKRRAVSLVGLSRSYFYYVAHPRDDRAERARIREIAQTRMRYGMWRIHTLMRREGWLINHKKTYRIYCDEGLNLRRKRPAGAWLRPIGSSARSCPVSTSAGAWILWQTACSMAGAFGR
jgi:transposase InsO family protein